MIPKVVCYATHMVIISHDENTIIRLKLSFSQAASLESDLHGCLEKKLAEAGPTFDRGDLDVL